MTFAIPVRCLWSHTLGARSIYWVHLSREEWNDVKYVWNNSYLNCGCTWKWRMCGFIAQLVEHRTGIWFSQPLRWSFFTFMYKRSSNMNYFTYTSHRFTPHGRDEVKKLTSLPMCGFIAKLVEHRAGIAEVTGSNSVEALIFSGFFFPINCLNWKINCDDHSSLLCTTAVQIWIISHILHIVSKTNILSFR